MKNKKLLLVGILGLVGMLSACEPKTGMASSSAKTKSSRVVKKNKVNFDLNYEGAPETTVVEIEGGKGVRPLAEEPTREGRAFMGWTATPNGDSFYQFGKEIEEDLTLYAKWADAGLKKYVFEAEYCPCISEADDGKGMTGSTYSGGTTGVGLIQEEGSNMPADSSNGFWVHFLYQKNADLIFEIEAEEACTANIYMRLSGEYLTPEFTMESPDYLIKHNNQEMSYSAITFTDIPDQGAGWLAFNDYALSLNVNLTKGTNKFEMITNNDVWMKGTAYGLAPMVD